MAEEQADKKAEMSQRKDFVRTGLDAASIKQAFLDNLYFVQGKFPPIATKNDYYMALAYTIRDRLMNFWTKTSKTYLSQASRTVCYFSAEFLLGPQLGNNINNLGIWNEVMQAMHELGLNLSELMEQEAEPGLGNGGLGRLAACCLDSLATLNIPTIGYGIRYEFGIFNQSFQNGWQVENTDKWLCYGNPWEIGRPEISFNIKLGGHIESYLDNHGRYQVRWVPDQMVKSIAYDIPILGYQANTANMLRLWKAEACESFDFGSFNQGDYYGAVQEKIKSENITKVLYPNDEPVAGKKLRLMQQYFFVSSSLQDMIRIYKQRSDDLRHFHEKYTVQLNDTHPAISIAELMRLFIDEYQFDWDEAWAITQKTFHYTNHTILPEALEKWPVDLFAGLLPRHLDIIFEINRRFLNDIRIRYPNDSVGRIQRLSLIDEEGCRYIRMANLACVGSSTINGVSELHTELLKKEVLKDFYELFPEKFSNKTNGVTPRRFMMLDNPRLSTLLRETIGDRWIKHLDVLRELEAFATDRGFQEKWRSIKIENKRRLADKIQQWTGIVVDHRTLFDVQVKRIHEYKRQHLNLLHAVTLYHRIRSTPGASFVPRTIIFAGKAAPGYYLAKLMIKLINSVADVVNHDPVVKDRLKIVFIPDFNVKRSQWIYPAAELSEQISTAGKEASGTGNMKFALNGAITIGTLDGANVEIREAVGAENFFLFGLTTEEVRALKAGGYDPCQYLRENEELRAAIDLIDSGIFSNNDKRLFKPLTDNLIYHDEYMLCADYGPYIHAQEKVAECYLDQKRWTTLSILNVARSGKFSSDRCIQDYCDDIWKVSPVKISR